MGVSTWTNDTAQDILTDILHRIRAGVQARGWKSARLPGWVSAARVRSGWVGNSLIAVFEPANEARDRFELRGAVRADLSVLLDIDDYAPISTSHPIVGGPGSALTGSFVLSSYGDDGAPPPKLIYEQGCAFLCPATHAEHGPVAVLGLCFELRGSPTDTGPVALRIVDLALIVSSESLKCRDSLLGFVEREALTFLEVIQNGSVGARYETKNRQTESVSVAKAKTVIVLGSCAPQWKRELGSVRDALLMLKYDAHLIEDYPDTAGMHVTEKVAYWTRGARFVVMVDREPSGHCTEFPGLEKDKCVVCFLHPKDSLSTRMLARHPLSPQVGRFAFDLSPLDVLDDAVTWAERTVALLEQSFPPAQQPENSSRTQFYDERGLPSLDALRQLPTRARVAFGARCARRVLPMYRIAWPTGPARLTQMLDRVIRCAEEVPRPSLGSLAEAFHEAPQAANAALEHFGMHDPHLPAKEVAMAVCHAAGATINGINGDALVEIGEVLDSVAYSVRGLSEADRELVFEGVRRDFEAVRAADIRDGSREGREVRAELFGQLWPLGAPKGWDVVGRN